MLKGALIVLGYYAVAISAMVVWVYRDFEASRRRAERATAGGRVASAFALRTALLIGVLAAAGTTLVLALLLVPAPLPWQIAAISAGVLVATALLVEVALLLLPRITRTDPLRELRAPGTAAAAAPADGARDLPV